MQKQPLIILTGPTAVGKTKASIGLAKAIGGEIISADSMQVYKYMDIGSAKIRPEEMQHVPHYLVDELEPDDEFHVVRFQQMAKEAMKKSLNKQPSFRLQACEAREWVCCCIKSRFHSRPR